MGQLAWKARQDWRGDSETCSASLWFLKLPPPPWAQCSWLQILLITGRRQKAKVLGGGRGRAEKNAKPIKTPFTFAAVKLYSDFSTHDMNNNQASFSGIAKLTTPVRPFASRIIPGRLAPGWRPKEKGCSVQAGLGIRRPARPWARVRPGCQPAGGLTHSNLQRQEWNRTGPFQKFLPW
jgi:hypothetical protein